MQPHRLLHDRLEPRVVLGGGPVGTGAGRGLLAAAQQIGVLAELAQRPRQRRRGRLVPGEQQGDELVAQLGVAERLTFLGARPNQEMPGLLSSGDLAIFPSLMEATSIAALEAMSCELPVAASRVGGLPEIVSDAVGGLFEPADPSSLAAKVIELLGGGQLRVLGAEARRRVLDKWSNARLADRHLEIYEELVARRHAA